MAAMDQLKLKMEGLSDRERNEFIRNVANRYNLCNVRKAQRLGGKGS